MKRLSNESGNRERFFRHGRTCVSAFLCVIAILPAGLSASAARVIFYQAENGNPDIEARLTLACRFYGIDLEKPSDTANKPSFPAAPTAVVIEASCLDRVVPSDIPENAKALLIAGINRRTSADALKTWAGGNGQAGQVAITGLSNCFLQVSSTRADVAHQLAGQKLPADIAVGFHLEGTVDSTIISYPDGRPLFVQINRQSRPVYLLADFTPVHPPDADIWFYDHSFFVEIAPYMMFLKQAFGEYGWHADGHYANLTIDDLWLRDSYGSLRFADLFKETERANFHTTIAFIPWNYDRSFSPEVVKLFRERPDRFSLSVHGNNHDHHEFYRYENVPGSRWPIKPLAEQEADIRQGIARMEAMRQATGLPYDLVMVFPHDIAPDATLGLLRKYNFLATANIGNVPLDAPRPRDPLFWLRRTTDAFSGLASLDRIEVHNRTIADIAVDLFLDNPVLFVEHLLFFSNDPAAFNRTAQIVNEIQPGIQWAGLGTIARHLYIMRRVSDETYAVRMFSPEIILRNNGSEQRIYRITKKDPGDIPVRQVLVDNHPAPFALNPDDHLQLELSIPAGAERHVQITYQNNFDPAQENLAKNDRSINIRRRLSDVRDFYLTSGPIGILIDRYYYGTGYYALGLKGLIALVSAAALVLIIIVITIKKRRRGRP